MHALLNVFIRLLMTLLVLPFWLQQWTLWGPRHSKFADKKVLTVLWWNKKTVKRVADLITKIDNRCNLTPKYRQRHRRNVYLRADLKQFLMMYESTHL